MNPSPPSQKKETPATRRIVGGAINVSSLLQVNSQSVESQASTRMSKSERDDLARLIRQRAKVAKASAIQRSTKLIADFELQMDKRYAFNSDEIWKASVEAVENAYIEAQAKVEKRCRELGIPDRFAPSIYRPSWCSSGENEFKQRRADLRRIAAKQIEAIEKTACLEIERISVQTQTELIANGLISEESKAFLERMPSIEELMPALEVTRIERLLK
jgi:hypothetical protein